VIEALANVAHEHETELTSRTYPWQAKIPHMTACKKCLLVLLILLLPFYRGCDYMQGERKCVAWAWEEIKKFGAGSKFRAG
jgi:hypothetical protein